MLYIYAAQVKDGQLQQYQEWLSKNERRIKRAAPKSWKFIGVYFPVFGFGPHLSEIHWEVENYASFDAAHNAGHKDGEYSRLVREWYSYLDVQTQSARLLKRATDPATVVSAS